LETLSLLLDNGEDFGVEGVEFMEAKSSSTLIVFSLPWCDIVFAKKVEVIKTVNFS
jgi:hypothetical protein